MKHFTVILLACLLLGAAPFGYGQDDQSQIRALTSEFCAAMVKGDLSVLDRIFDPSPSNVYYDINEGPLMGLARLKRIWQAATRNSRLTKFEFGNDMRIDVDGNHALQTGTWTQAQIQQDGTTREVTGRATILWKKTGDGWRVYHYHGSVTPRRQRM
jgi:ketosteroid isomerase-like protein